MTIKIQIKRSTVTASPSTTLDIGELAYSYLNSTLYIGGAAGVGAAAIPIGGAGAFAALNSPVFTGDPQAPTPAAADNDTSIATTAWVKLQSLSSFLAPTGDISWANNKITNLAAPTANGDAANKAYVDSVVQGLDSKASVRLRATANITIATPGAVAANFDGVVPANGDRILLSAQTTAAENGIYCVDTQTQLLTDKGWKYYNELAVGDIALTLNMTTGQSEWQPILDLAIFPKKSYDVLAIQGKSHNSITTDNHRWPVFSRHQENISIKLSKELNSSHSLIKAASSANQPNINIYTNEVVELVAWFVCEGHLRKNNNGVVNGSTRITQSHKVNLQHCLSIKSVLKNTFGPEQNKLGYKKSEAVWTTYLNNDNTVFNLNATASETLLKLAPNKVPTIDFIKSMTIDQLKLFINICIKADGHKNNTISIGQFIQKREDILSAVELIAILAGYSTNTSKEIKETGCKILTISTRSTYNPIKNSNRKCSTVEYKKYEDIFWCPKTANTTWLAKREGTVYYTGNTYNGAASAMTRAEDANISADVNAGQYMFVEEGTTSADTGWILITNNPITLGTTALTYTQFNGTGSIVDGAGLSYTGNTLNVGTASAARIVVNANNIDLATTAVTPGTYIGFTVDAYGRVTGVTTPTTLAGYGITDAQALDADLTAIAALTGTGLLVRTGTNTWTNRTLTGTANRITVTNGDGVAGAPTVDIASTYVGQTSITTLGTIATGTWNGSIVGAAYGGTGANLTGGGNADRLVVTNVGGTALTTTNLVDGGTF